MFSFKNFILNEQADKPKARVGLPHLGDLSHKDLMNVTRGGHVDLSNHTVKTDGSAVHIRWTPEKGLETRHSGIRTPDGVRNPQEYMDHAKAAAEKAGRDVDYTGAKAHAELHMSLQNNEKFIKHCQEHYKKYGSCEMRGEFFSRRLSRPSEEHKGEVVQSSTPVHPKHMGKHGMFVLHSQLPENEHHGADTINRFSDSNLTFDHDKQDIPADKAKVDVREEHEELKKVDHNLANQRITPKNKEAVQNEREKLSNIGKRIYSKVRAHAEKHGFLKNKWGSGHGEGIVVPGSVRYKITSTKFAEEIAKGREEKQKKMFGRGDSDASLPKLEEAFLILEGGNIKIVTKEGEVGSSDIPTDNRKQRIASFKKTLGAVHDAFHKKFGEHLFGKNKSGLENGSAYSGSTRNFIDSSIPDSEFQKFKPHMGDFDTQVHLPHKNKLEEILKPGAQFGDHTVVGTKKHGNQISAVMRHKNGEVHQIDFAGVHDVDKSGEPTKGSQFLNNSSWEDTKKGIKGSHHKILLNAVAGETHKFNIIHGLKSREDEEAPGEKEPVNISKKLFGAKADHSKIESFTGVSELIKKHIPRERHQEIYNKFKESLKTVKHTNHAPALKHLRDSLGVIDTETLSEAVRKPVPVASNEQHAHVCPLYGGYPITHTGQRDDVEDSITKQQKKFPGKGFVGLSGGKSTGVFSDKERENIARRQSAGGVNYKVQPTAGRAIADAFESMKHPTKRKILHIHVGHDRKDFAEHLKKSIEQGKILALNGQRPDEVRIHLPKDKNRSHGLSGTRMRQAAHDGDLETFHRHIGKDVFSKEEAKKMMNRMGSAIRSGKISIKRK